MEHAAAVGDQYVEWNGTRVPPSVKRALEQRYRGQEGLGDKTLKVLSFYEDKPELKDADQAQLGRAGASPSRLSMSRNVVTRLILNADHSVNRGPFAYNHINASKLLISRF